MRCRVGDLALRIKADIDDAIPCGAIVRCVEYFSGPAIVDLKDGNFSGWLVEYGGKVKILPGAMLGVPDEHLLPIRDPGEDDQDETLLWKPVPSTVKETA